MIILQRHKVYSIGAVYPRYLPKLTPDSGLKWV